MTQDPDTPRYRPRPRDVLPLVFVLALLALVYAPTLLTRPGSGENPYMDDVGEIQVALNVWGTIHLTGYPLYTMLGSAAVAVMRAVGIAPIVAPVLYSLGWGLIALSLFYLLILRLTGQIGLAMAGTLVLGLVRSVWIHNVIAEVYSMTLAIQMILLILALWSPISARNAQNRVLWMALVGGFGVAHHRMVAFMAPGLLLAVAPGLLAVRPTRRLIATILLAIPLALFGFLPYLYLPARALAGGVWIYGDPRTLAGVWHEFSGAEVAYLMRLPADLAALVSDAVKTVQVVAAEMTLPLALGGLIGLTWAAWRSRFRREVRIVMFCAAGYVIFLTVLHRAVMPEAVSLFISAAIVFGLIVALDGLLPRLQLRGRRAVLIGVTALAAGLLFAAHFEAIRSLTGDSTGLTAIATARRVPRDDGRAVLMLPWSSRHTAVGFSKYVTGENADLALVTHTADLGALVRDGHTLYTFPDILYRFPPAWWAGQIGGAHLSAAADGVIAVRPAPDIEPSAPNAVTVTPDIVLRAADACRDGSDSAQLRLTWQALARPDRDYSVFVHVLGAPSPVPLQQADSAAPVYGWYPTTAWAEGEVVADEYRVSLPPEAVEITVGLYEQPTPGQFINHPAITFRVDSLPACESAS